MFRFLLLLTCVALLPVDAIRAQSPLPLPEVTPDLPAAAEADLAQLSPPQQIDYLLDQAVIVEGEDLNLSLTFVRRARTLATTPAEHLQVSVREQINVMRRGFYREGLEYGRRLVPEAHALQDAPTELLLRIAVGHAERLLGEFTTALHTFEEALKFSSALSDNDAEVARILNEIAIIYLDQSDLTQALRYSERACAIAQTLPRTYPRDWVLNANGVILTELGRYDEAIASHQEALEIRRATRNNIGVADSMQNLANIARLQGDFDTAIFDLQEALPVYLQINARGNEVSARHLLADIYLQQGQISAAAEHVEASRPVIEAIGDQTHELEYYRLSARLREAQGRLTEALDYVWRYTELRDQLAGENTKRSLATLQSEAEIARRDADIANLERDRALAEGDLERAAHKLSRTRTLYLSGGASIIALCLAVVLVLRARNRAARRILQETEAARLAAETANTFKSRLLAIASHDLKSPLRAVEAAAARIESAPADTSTVASFSTNIRAQARRMFGLISELIDHSAIEAGGLQIIPRRISVEPALRQALDRHRATASAKQIRLALFASPEATTAEAQLDPARFDQVLDNLIDNAIKFSPLDSDIDIDFQCDGSSLRISVRDQGPGFTSADLAQAFQPFQSLSAQPTADEGSSGLGLNIAQEIINRHGGTLSIDSAPGEGAELIIELPAAT